MNMEQEINTKIDELRQLLIAKNRDYKGASFDLGLKGNIVHIWDKTKRYKNLAYDKNSPNFESTRDTLLDIAGYAIIGLIILDEN